MQEFMTSVDQRMSESAARLESLECLWGLDRPEGGEGGGGADADSEDSDTDSLARVGDDDDTFPPGQPSNASRRLTVT